jgi:hypothetical protein
MKKRVRIYKPENQWRAQMGGFQATEAAAPQAQLTDEDLISATVKMLAQGSQPEEVLNSLVENGVEQQKATQAVQYSVDYIKAAQEGEYSDVEADEQAQQDAALEEAAAERQAIEAQEAEARQARMQEMYGLTEDNTTQDYSDDDQLMMDMMRYGGLPSKRTYVKNAVKLAKKQMGGQEQPATQSNRADNTDTGDRQAKLQKFVGSLQNHANEALMKQDAEAAYSQMQMMQPQNPFMPMAQEGGEQAAAQLNPRQQRQMARQQRQMGRQMNRMIGNIPVGLYNNRGGGLPTNIGVINMPAIGTGGLQSLMSGMAGAQSMIPAMGSIMGGPKLANIDVRKTGLFGRPKQYSITFAQDVVTNPTTAENAAKQEVKNIEEEAKEVEEKVETAAEDVKKADEAVKAETAATTKSSSGTKAKSTTKSNISGQDILKRAGIDTSLEAIRKRNTTDFTDAEQVKNWMRSLPSSQDQLNYIKRLEEMPAFKTNKVQQDLVKYLYANVNYQAGSSGDPVKDFLSKSSVAMGPQAAQSWDDFWLTGVTGGANALVKAGAKAAPFTFKTISKQLPYSGYDVRYSFQQGGMTDEQSGLYKFVYGGNDMYMPAPAGKITDDPYFAYGGLTRYQDKGEVTTDTETTTDAATTTAKTPDYSINPMTGKAWTENEWAMASKLLGNAVSGNTSTTETKTDASTDAQTNTGYNYGYNTGVGPIYPPMFGRGRGLQNLLNFTPYGANPIATYAGTWAQQKGLPIDPATGQAYTGAFANPQIAKIDVRKSGLLGRPKRYSIDYMVDDVAGTSSFLNPEDYPGGVNPGPGGTAATTAPTTTSDGLTIDPATGEPLPAGRQIKNQKMKSFMSRIPGVRNMINWGDAEEMTPEDEAAFKYEQEVARNTAAEESGDIEAPPVPEDQAAAKQTPSSMDPMLASRMAAKDNAFYEEMEGAEAPPMPGQTQGSTEDQRRYQTEMRQEPMVEGLPEGTPEEVRSQLAQQQALSPSSFAEYQAGPMQNIDNQIAEQFGVPQSMVDQFAYQDNMGDSGFDLSTQQGFDRQQYLNEALGREQLDVNQRPSVGTIPVNSLEQLNTEMTPGEIVQSPQYKADYENTIAELTKQGKPITQANIMQEFGRQQAGQSVRQQQAEAAVNKPVTNKTVAKKASNAMAKTNSGSSKSKTTGNIVTNFTNLSYNEKEEYMNKLIDMREASSDKAYRVEVQKIINQLKPILNKDLDKALASNEDNRYKQIKDQDNYTAWLYGEHSKDELDEYGDPDINVYLNLQKSGKLKNYPGKDYYKALRLRTQQYGGMQNTPRNLYRAYDGVQTPVSGDPRFASSYEEMMRNIADEETGLLVPPPIQGEQAPGMKQVEFGDVEGIRQNAAYSDKVFGTNYTEDYGLNKPGRKKVRVDYKNKNMFTIDPQQAVNAGLMGAQGLTRFLNAGDERKREQELARSLTADNVYGTRSNLDRGTYDVNSGLFRQDQMGFTGVAKYGGAQFKQGGTTYMSAAQVKKFLEEGGELEFV